MAGKTDFQQHHYARWLDSEFLGRNLGNDVYGSFSHAKAQRRKGPGKNELNNFLTEQSYRQDAQDLQGETRGLTHFLCIARETGNETRISRINTNFIGIFEDFGCGNGNEGEVGTTAIW